MEKFTLKNIFPVLLVSCLCLLTACKKSPDTAPAEVPERLEITTATGTSILTGASLQLGVKFYNNRGQEMLVPTPVMWTSENLSVASVSSSGTVTGLAVGESKISAKYNNLSTSITINVLASSNEIATILVTPSPVVELLRNDSLSLVAEARTLNGNILTGIQFTWQGDNSNAVQLGNMGKVKGISYGTSLVIARSGNIQSQGTMVQVIRRGNFSGSGSAGEVKLKVENNLLILQTTSSFTSSNGAPDLRIYLSNSTNNSGALEIATLNMRSGAQTWNVPGAATLISQYRYVIIWCKQFGGNYGTADLGL